MIKNKFLKVDHLHQKILILHLTMFLDQIDSIMRLLFKVLTLRPNIKFKSQKIGDNNLRFIVKVLRFLIKKFKKKNNILLKEGYIRKVHLIRVILLLILPKKLNVKPIKCHKKKSFWMIK